jgi:hypothetical protein
MQKHRAGCGPAGKRDPHAAFWLRFLPEAQELAGVRFGKCRFKCKSGQPDPDACTITLTCKHIPETLQRALNWSAARHWLTE